MIIELFGPPGSGKTTFARALAVRLQERGRATELVLSYRPAERLEPWSTPLGRDRAFVVRRLVRPILEMLTLARHPLVNAHDVGTALKLVRALPPKAISRAIREIQYIARLSHGWQRASAANYIVLFDQAYVQAVCSLAMFSGVADEGLLARALDFIPKSDLLIRLDAPLECLKKRLCDRRRVQSAVEQLFEIDLKTSLGSIEFIDQLHELLLRQGRSVTCASSLDQRSLGESIESVERQINSTLLAEHRGAA